MLIDDVRQICERLARRGWRRRLLAVTAGYLDIKQDSAAQLMTALTADIPSIDRTALGFEDFHPTSNRAITSASPARSLLYHALASPNVHPTPSGMPARSNAAYPTLAELDTIENLIYSFAADRTDLDDAVIAVFAYQYRPVQRSTHQRYADIAFSRTGVARVGMKRHHYDRRRRSFWVARPRNADALCVLPARYGAFLARRAKPGTGGSVLGGHSGVTDAEYLFPVHKLFAGRECLDGQDLSVDFAEFHRNEKLRKAHELPISDGGLPLPAGFDAAQLPFVRDSKNGGALVSLARVGTSTTLVVPRPHRRLLRTVAQRNSNTKKRQIVHFVVPRGPKNRVTQSTLVIPAATLHSRLAPEYVNMRQRVDPNGPATQTPENLNELGGSAFEQAMTNGGFPAAHFTDDSCDGCVEAFVSGLTTARENYPAFSLVTAPDFFPLADQSDLARDPEITSSQVLSDTRIAVNPTLPRPSNSSEAAFRERDTTLTAVVGARSTGEHVVPGDRPNELVSFLPDAAAGVFAPGWDSSRSADGGGEFLTTSGLGSPFPEDIKLCAAIASIWPAASPDSGRTFGNDKGPPANIYLGNRLPMLDRELGFHPAHEQVVRGTVDSYRGWDGEYGPFFEYVGRKLYVNYVAIERSDYVIHALKNRIRVSLTARVQSKDLVARNRALARCESLVTATSSPVCLVSLRQVDDWSTCAGRQRNILGKGFQLEFAELRGERKTTAELSRVRKEVARRYLFQVGQNGVAMKTGRGARRFIAD